MVSEFEFLKMLLWFFPKKTFTTWEQKEKKVEECNQRSIISSLWQFCVEKELSGTVGLSKKRKKIMWRSQTRKKISSLKISPLQIRIYMYSITT